MTSITLHNTTKINLKKLALNLASFAWLLFATQAPMAATDLANLPLNITGSSTAVLPNIMYVLDNSGSMGSDFMPDYVDDGNKCKSTAVGGLFSAGCGFGDPPRMSSTFNSIYYNPETTYTPGVIGNKSSKNSMDSVETTGWTQVPLDGYGVQGGTTKVSLIPSATDASIGYVDRVWCNTNTATTADLINPLVCKKNSQYIYPNNTGTQATSYNQPYNLRGHPYYYAVAAGEYCSDKNLTTCVAASAPTGAFIYPAKLRWCNSSARTNCQAKYIEGTNYTFAKWSGVNNGTSSTGKIRINADTVGCGSSGLPSCVSPSAVNITDVKVDGVRIVASPVPALSITDTTNSTQRNTLANNIRDAINNFVPSVGDDFTATTSGNEITISRAGVGAFNGTIDVTASSVTRAAINGTKSSGNITITRAGKANTTSTTASNIQCRILTPNATNCAVTITISQIRVGNPSSTNINSGNIVYNTTFAQQNSPTTRYALATLIRDNINSAISAPQDYTATCGGLASGACTSDILSIRAVNETPSANGLITITSTTTPDNANFTFIKIDSAGGVLGIPAKTYTLESPTTLTITQFNGGTPVVNTFSRTDIEPSTPNYPKAATRTDCLGSTCTYAEEMTNFANWYSYYRTRMQMMKTSTSLAFKEIDSKFRVGFITIANQSANYVPVSDFTLTQKTSWYNQLLGTSPVTNTPLRSALSLVGQIYAGRNPVAGFTADPVQFSCQQNYALLTTDGYWNGGVGTDLDGTAIGNLDGNGTPRPLYEGSVANPGTLADVAKYYYDTDLRDSAAGGVCTGSVRPDGTTGDVCNNNVFTTPTDNNTQQHMTTFTLGLGVDATLTYEKDYKTATSGDFYDLKQGAVDWSTPVANSQSAVDDLWHAAVNGQGTYFSAKNPTQLSDSLNDALRSIVIKTGSGAAAATSTLQPVQNDNFAYVASYTSVKWTGNLEKRTVSTSDGTVSRQAVWCLESIPAATSCDTPSSIVSEPASSTNGNTAKTYCVTPSATLATCSATNLDSSNNCKVEIAPDCTGTMSAKVSSNADFRTIYMNKGGALNNFNYANLLVAGKNTNFESAFLQTKLSQWPDLTADQRLAVNATNLVSYLRGSTGFEDRTENVVGAIDNRIYRLRETVLGDLANSPPVFVGSPKANYNDPGYGPSALAGTFKNAQNTRAGTVYVGGNDGMLHAIDATTGQEKWAYIPTAVIPDLYKLADKKYGDNHSYFVDGELVINDVCTNNCGSASATWKTILVAGLNGGGKGYFALDITNPATPSLLWEYGNLPDYSGDLTFDADLGNSYGNPVITKRLDGKWVVLITSGYNNPSNIGFLSVLDVQTGAELAKYSTTGGTAADPAGFAKINAYVEDSGINNTSINVYGGDLLGNIWRFDINAASGSSPFKMAELKGPAPGNTPQPITVRPELGNIDGKRVVFVGTGRYLGKSDLNNADKQSFYAIKDDNGASPTTLVNPRASSLMVEQALVNSGSTGARTVSNPQPVNSSDRGWFFDFPDNKERQNVPAQLVFGTILIPSTVPTNTDCSPGGYGWLNFLDYKTGRAVAGSIVAVKTNAPIVGLNVLYVKGKPVTNIVTADNPDPVFIKDPPYNASGSGEFTNHRVIWRELIDEE